MKIDGRALANEILADCASRVKYLKHQGVVPTLAVILAGENAASRSYIRQKQKAADKIGAQVRLTELPPSVTETALKDLIRSLNSSQDIHGIIIQRPLPSETAIPHETLLLVDPRKDVDGFVPGSAYPAPVVAAVGEILRQIFRQTDRRSKDEKAFRNWLTAKAVCVIGRGETAGAPIAAYFQHLQCATSIIHSRTPDPDSILSASDIIISCVGKADIVPAATIKEGTIIISVGIWRDREGKLHGDYDDKAMAEKAAFYTPTPGGVGPVNVACLMKNLIAAAEHLKKTL